jgi:hypothetical protein
MKRMLVVALIVLFSLCVSGLAQAGYRCTCKGENGIAKWGCGNGAMGGAANDTAMINDNEIGKYITNQELINKLKTTTCALDNNTGWLCCR